MPDATEESSVEHQASVAHQAYVDALKESGHLVGPTVERAFRRVPRHLFVERFFTGGEAQGWTLADHDPDRPDPAHPATIYSDEALATRLVDNRGTSSTSQPSLVARMLHLLELRPGARVLEIGAGTGYNAPLIAAMVGDPRLVTTIDIQEDVADQARRGLARAGLAGATVHHRDGAAERSAWTDLGDDAARVGFWFYLGLSEPRVRLFRWFSFGLHDPTDGRTARVDRDRLASDPGLLDDLERRHQEWLDLGAPELRRFRVRFARLDAEGDAREDAAPMYTRERDAAEPTWSLLGRYFQRIVTLA